MSELSAWQRPDGFPTDGYFDAVLEAVTARGIPVESGYRNEDWEYAIELDPAAQREGSLARWDLIVVSWRCSEDDAPAHEADFTGLGWYWVPYHRSGDALGAFAEEFALPWLAEPQQVAEAVSDLLSSGA